MNTTHLRNHLAPLVLLTTNLLAPSPSPGQSLHQWLVQETDQETLTLVTREFARLWSKEQNIAVARRRSAQADPNPNDLQESQFPTFQSLVDTVDRQSLVGNIIHFRKSRRIEPWFPYWAWVETQTGKVDMRLKPKDEFEDQRYQKEVSGRIDSMEYTAPRLARLVAVAKKTSNFNFDAKILTCGFGNPELHGFGDSRFENTRAGNSFDNALWKARKDKNPLTTRPLGDGTSSVLIYRRDGKERLSLAELKTTDGDAEFIQRHCGGQVVLFMDGAIEENPGSSAPFQIRVNHVRGVAIPIEEGESRELPSGIIELK